MFGISKDAHKEAIIERAISAGIGKHGNELDISKLAKVLEELEGGAAKALAETLYPYTEKGYMVNSLSKARPLHLKKC
jgi:hypothetical protein